MNLNIEIVNPLAIWCKSTLDAIQTDITYSCQFLDNVNHFPQFTSKIVVDCCAFFCSFCLFLFLTLTLPCLKSINVLIAVIAYRLLKRLLDIGSVDDLIFVLYSKFNMQMDRNHKMLMHTP